MAHPKFLSIAVISLPGTDRWWSKSISSLSQKWFPFLGCRWCFTVWTLLGEKSHLTGHTSVTICYESSPLPCSSEKLKECLGFEGSLSQGSHLARDWPYVTQHSDHSGKMSSIHPGYGVGFRADLTALWGHSTSNQHSLFTVSVAPCSFLLPHIRECGFGYSSNSNSCPVLTSLVGQLISPQAPAMCQVL